MPGRLEPVFKVIERGPRFFVEGDHWMVCSFACFGKGKDYRGSSAWLVALGNMSPETGLPYELVVDSLGAWVVERENQSQERPEA